MVLAKGEEEKQASVWDSLTETAKSDLELVRRELKEITLMVEQSQLEVGKLTRRNALITSHLQQVQAQFDSMPRSDIRMAYDSALDAQQRLFVMRGQFEKLQSDRVHIANYQTFLEKFLQAIESGQPLDSGPVKFTATSETVEMMIQAQESERKRLARQMHDGPAQALSNFILQTEIAMRLFDIDQARAKSELASLKAAATSTFQKVRDFIFELRPMMLDDLGLTPTISRYVEAAKEQTGIDIRLTVMGLEQRLEPYLEVMIFRAIQELVGNSIHYSQATQVKVQIDVTDNSVKVSVDDNGKGFKIESIGERGGMGLKVIKDRAEMLGGSLEVDSEIGQGAHVTFQIPATKTKVFA